MPSSPRKNRRIVAPSPSMVVAALALFMSLGGASYAATKLAARRAAPTVGANAITHGPRGPRGFRGPRGIAGSQGAAGPQGAAGDPGAPAVVHRALMAFENSSPQVSVSSTYSQVEVIGTITKIQSNSVLRVEATDTVGLDGGGAGCALQVRVDGVNSNGVSSSADTGDEAVVGSFSSAVFPAHVVAEFTGLPAGQHTVSLWLRATYLNSGTSVCIEGAGINFRSVEHSAIVEEMS